MKTYSVINLDIVGSRRIKERDRFQSRLNDFISIVYHKYSKILPTPISITLGDEWQLITDSPSESYTLVQEFQQLLWLEGIELYAGIGIGDLSTSIYDDIRKMDGTSFHSAREALNIAKKQAGLKTRALGSKRNKVFFKTDKEVVYGIDYWSKDYSSDRASANEALSETAATAENYIPLQNKSPIGFKTIDIINTIVENNEILKSKMTQKQKEAFINYKKFGSYREIVRMQPENLRESISSISQKLNTAEYFTIQKNDEMVRRLLEYLCVLRSVLN